MKTPREFWIYKDTNEMLEASYRSLIGHNTEEYEEIRVREVLPNELTPEEVMPLKAQLVICEEALKETNEYLLKERIFIKSNGVSSHVLEFMWVTEALSKLSAMRGSADVKDEGENK